jgi:hypothetical protein
MSSLLYAVHTCAAHVSTAIAGKAVMRTGPVPIVLVRCVSNCWACRPKQTAPKRDLARKIYLAGSCSTARELRIGGLLAVTLCRLLVAPMPTLPAAAASPLADTSTAGPAQPPLPSNPVLASVSRLTSLARATENGSIPRARAKTSGGATLLRSPAAGRLGASHHSCHWHCTHRWNRLVTVTVP